MELKTLKTRTIRFDGKDREYDVVNRNLGADCPRWFISYGNGLPFISDEVPEEYMDHMVFHELYEFETLANHGEGKCLESLKAELERVPEDQRKDYMNFRKGVFESLVQYLERTGGALLPETQKSLDHLRRLAE